MKILLVSGFLGAGKTTFIKAMAKATGREFVILENEFADTDVDGALLKREAPEMQVWELSEGCICCSLNLDFTYSVLTIENTLHPDYLIVEPSGVARPAQIVQNLARLNYDKVSLLAPVTLVDSEHCSQHRLQFPDYFNDQVLTAGTVVLSKSEQLSPAEFQQIKEQLQLPGDVSFPEQHYCRWSAEVWQKLLHTAFTGTDLQKIGERFKQFAVGPEADTELRTYTVQRPCFKTVPALYLFLSDLLQGRYGQVVRAKGLVNLNRSWLHVELAGQRFSITGLEQADLAGSGADEVKKKEPAGVGAPAGEGIRAKTEQRAEGERAGAAAPVGAAVAVEPAAALVVIGKALKTEALAAFSR